VIRWQPHSASALVAALMTMLLLGGCSQGSTETAANPSGSPVPSVPGAVPRADHVLLVVFENKAYVVTVCSVDHQLRDGVAVERTWGMSSGGSTGWRPRWSDRSTNLRRGHYELGLDIDRRHRLPAVFSGLARVIWSRQHSG